MIPILYPTHPIKQSEEREQKKNPWNKVALGKKTIAPSYVHLDPKFSPTQPSKDKCKRRKKKRKRLSIKGKHKKAHYSG
jgi:hypothetical protein